jgi:hypothetical protein
MISSLKYSNTSQFFVIISFSQDFLAFFGSDDDDDVYLRIQHGKRFHNIVYMSYVKHINPACKAKVMNTTIQSIYATILS